MFKYLSSLIEKPADFPAAQRIWDLRCKRAVLDGTIYDKLAYEFHDEENGNGEYIKLKQRAPSVRYNICRVVVEDATALLFSEGMFPGVAHGDADVKLSLEKLIADSNLPEVMTDATIRGSVGSVAVYMRVLNGRVFWSVYDTDYLTPEYDSKEPDVLIRMSEKYKVTGADLIAAGYTIPDDAKDTPYWVQRVWDTDSEKWYTPWKVSEKDTVPTVDEKRSVTHDLGFCPWTWIKNLPGGTDIDGKCTFRPAVDTQIVIEYQLSQANRGLTYSSDPTMVIKNPSQSDAEMKKGADTAIVVSDTGDVKLLEITGTAANTVVEFCKSLRQMALETIGGSRAEADKVTAPQSGRAQELMYQPLIWLADKMRSSYGQNGLLDMLRMVVRASEKFPLRTRDEDIGKLPPGAISLVWPDWFPATAGDRMNLATTLSTLRTAEIISRESAVSIIAPMYDIPDVQAELSKIKTDMADADARTKSLEATVTATETVDS